MRKRDREELERYFAARLMPKYEFESTLNIPARMRKRHIEAWERRAIKKIRARCLLRRLVVLEDTVSRLRNTGFATVYLRAEPSWVHGGLGCMA